MSLNSSSSSNTSILLPPLNSSNSSSFLSSLFCFKYRSTFFIYTAFSITNILVLLPFCGLVLFLGLRRWQTQRSASSYSDIFTYHMVALEMVGIAGCALYCCGVCVNVPQLLMAGIYLFMVTTNGQIFFHIVTCVDRHVAVVHPITYLGLKNRGGARFRDITIGCVWLLVFGSFGLTSLSGSYSTVPSFCSSGLSIVIVSFCSLSVLRALLRPGPGEGSRVDQSKMKAFHTIMAIMGALLFRFGGHLTILAIFASSAVSERVRCGILVSGCWFCLPSSLVLPLLFLLRARKVQKNNSDSGSD